MPDEIDHAQERQETALAAQIEAARRGTPTPATGACLNCGKKLRRAKRFCDADCRDDHERRYLARGRNGKV